jgi:proton-coupled amino acid transporter
MSLSLNRLEPGDEEQEEQEELEGGASLQGAATNLAKLCIGSGILALPFAVTKGGLLFSPLCIAVIAVWNGMSCRYMIECKYASEHKSFPDNLSSTYSRIAYCSAGWTGVYITDASIIITLLGVCVTYQITCTKLLEDFFESMGGGFALVRNTELALFTLVVLALPVLLIDDVAVLAPYSVAGLVMLLGGVAAIVLYGLVLFGPETLAGISAGANALPLFPASLTDFSTFIGISTFGVGVCSLVFPVEEGMKFRSEFGKAVSLALISVWATYSVMGVGVSLLFVHDPDGISSNILENLPQRSYAAEVVRVSFSFVCLVTFPLAFVPPVSMIEHYLSQCGVWLAAAVAEAGSGGGAGPGGGLAWARGTVVPSDYESVAESSNHSPLAYPSSASSLSTSASSSSSSSPSLSSSSPSIVRSGAGLGGQGQGLKEQGQGHGQGNGLDDRLSPRRPSALLKYASRALILLGCTCVTVRLPCFGLIVSLLGCFTVSILSFVLPPFFRLKLVSMPNYEAEASGENNMAILLDTLSTGAGTLLCLTSTAVVARQIFSQSQSC